MLGSPSSYHQLQSMILDLDPMSHDCQIKIADIRHLMDAACDSRTITISQWRTLLENISLLRSRSGGADCLDANITSIANASARLGMQSGWISKKQG